MAAIHIAALLIVTSAIAKRREQQPVAHGEAAATAAAPASGREHLSAAACGTQYDAQYDAKGRRQEIAEPAGQSSKGESGKKLNSVRRK
jgi:hypothetical protein